MLEVTFEHGTIIMMMLQVTQALKSSLTKILTIKIFKQGKVSLSFKKGDYNK